MNFKIRIKIKNMWICSEKKSIVILFWSELLIEVWFFGNLFFISVARIFVYKNLQKNFEKNFSVVLLRPIHAPGSNFSKKWVPRKIFKFSEKIFYGSFVVHKTADINKKRISKFSYLHQKLRPKQDNMKNHKICIKLSIFVFFITFDRSMIFW